MRNSTTTTATTTLLPQRILDLYLDVIGKPMPIVIQKQCTYYLDWMSADVIECVLYETANAPYPSWRYAMAIIKRCMAAGIRTRIDFIDDASAFAGKRGSPGGE